MQGETSYDDLFEWAPTPFLELDSAGKLRRPNHAACELFGHSRTELQKRRIFDLTSQAFDISASRPFSCEFFHRTGRCLNTTAHLTKTPNGYRAAIVKVSYPLQAADTEKDELNQLVAELDFYRVRWETILHQLPGGILIVDATGRVVLTNDWMQKLTTSNIVMGEFRPVDTHRNHREKLSSRELQTLRLLSDGKTNKEIALVLTLSVRTVETHRANIMAKLNLHSIGELIHYAIRNKIIGM